MSSLKTLLVVLILSPMPGRAAEDTLWVTFASCAGRFSAELEHAWLMQDERADEIERHRRMLVDLVNATVLPDQRRRALHLRIDAKVAHGALLTQVAFSQDRDRAKWAERRASFEIDFCSGLLLDS